MTEATSAPTTHPSSLAPRLGIPPAAVRTVVPFPLGEHVSGCRAGAAVDAGAPPRLFSFRGLVEGAEHVALVFGDALSLPAPLVRIHSECLTGDVFDSARCDCGPQLQEGLALMRRNGGIMLYLRQEGRGIGLYNKLDAYRLQDQGLDTYAANRALDLAEDGRSYVVAAQMLRALEVDAVVLLTNNPDKAYQLERLGVQVVSQQRTRAYVTTTNLPYLLTKQQHGHDLNLTARAPVAS